MSRSVLVTGGNRGLGLAIAQAFVAAGDQVSVSSRSGTEVPEICCLPCDVTKSEEVDSLFAAVEARQGPVEVVVANAGIARDGLAARMSDTDFEEVVDTNLAGAFRVARRASRSMVRSRSGRMIFISSVNGLLGNVGQVNYAASKAGLVGLARSLARELGPFGITANVVAPGYARTDMTRSLREDRIDEIVRRVPLGRLAEPRDVAAAVAFLAGEGAGYITGAVVPVDGGLGMGH